MSNQKKIIWAVDAFEDKKKLLRAASILKRCIKSDQAVEPIYIAPPNDAWPPTELTFKLGEQNLEKAKKNLTDLASAIKFLTVLPPQILFAESVSTRDAVERLMNYAKLTEAEVIAVDTSSKTGLKRAVLGSFAETLIIYSHVPVVLMNPKTKPKAFKHVLYATDATESGETAFESFLDYAKAHKLQVTLYNKVEYFNQYTMSAIDGSLVYQKFLDEDLVRRKQVLEAMAGKARFKGIKVNIVLDSKIDSVSIPDSILRAARKYKIDLIGLPTKTGPVMSAILGSVGRQLARTATCPVWLLHPEKAAQPSLEKVSSQKRKAMTV